MRVNIVFDGPPGPEPGRFVEVETPDGHSISVGEWKPYPRRSDPKLKDWWVLEVEVVEQ